MRMLLENMSTKPANTSQLFIAPWTCVDSLTIGRYDLWFLHQTCNNNRKIWYRQMSCHDGDMWIRMPNLKISNPLGGQISFVKIVAWEHVYGHWIIQSHSQSLQQVLPMIMIEKLLWFFIHKHYLQTAFYALCFQCFIANHTTANLGRAPQTESREVWITVKLSTKDPRLHLWSVTSHCGWKFILISFAQTLR